MVVFKTSPLCRLKENVVATKELGPCLPTLVDLKLRVCVIIGNSLVSKAKQPYRHCNIIVSKCYNSIFNLNLWSKGDV